MPESAERASAAAAAGAIPITAAAARPTAAAPAGTGAAAADPLAPAVPSLKRLLAAWLLVPLLLLVPLAAALQYAVTLRAALSSLDHSLGDTALALGQLLRAEADGSFVFDLSPQTEQSLRTDRFDAIFCAVLDPAGRLLAGERALATLAPPRRVGS
ncbi:MAG: sensor histidine kinase N-terminal domain-containing protein, partial [Betaproteobacteria bacterium]